MNEKLKLMILVAEKQKWEIVAIIDSEQRHLAYCVVKNDKGEFVSYIFNTISNFELGHYFILKETAIEDMIERAA